MKVQLRRVATGFAATGIACAAALTAVGSAHAAGTTPPWEPDRSSVGGLVFYNSSGEAITSGSINDAPIAAYVQGTAAIRAGDTKATLYGYLPVSGQVPGQWSGEQMSASTTYPPATHPGNVSTTLPVLTGASDDESIATLAADFPNTDTSSDGYAGVYQLRLRTTAAGSPANVTYDEADILISGTTWSVLYTKGAGTSTSTTLKVKPSGTVTSGTSVKLTASVTPSAATGTINFRDGKKILKKVAVSGGSATLKTTKLKTGKNRLTAVYVPTDSSYLASTSAATTVTVKAASTKTTLKAPKTAKAKAKVKLSATEKPAVAGKITFLDGKKSLGALKVTKGKASLTVKFKKAGTYSLAAVFTPKDTDANAPSTSKVVKVKVKG